MSEGISEVVARRVAKCGEAHARLAIERAQRLRDAGRVQSSYTGLIVDFCRADPSSLAPAARATPAPIRTPDRARRYKQETPNADRRPRR